MSGAIAKSKRGLNIPCDFDQRTDPVFVVEGASDVAACVTLGLTAVGRPSNRSGVDQLTELLCGREIIVVGENDRKEDGK